MTDEIPFLASLRTQLVDAAATLSERRSRRRPLVLTSAAVLGVAVVLAAGLWFTAGPDGDRATALAVTRTEESITVRIVDLEASPDQVQLELAAAGIAATVAVIPVPPPYVGRFVGFGGYRPEGASESPAVQPVDGDGVSALGFVVPSDFRGPLDLRIGRRAEPGESYAGGNTDAFASGGPLACSGLWGLRVADAAPKLEALGVDARWQIFVTDVGNAATNEGPSVAGHVEEVDPHTIPELYVADAFALAADSVLIFAAPTPESPFVSSVSPEPGGCQIPPG